jgi:apolipoprotein N-acyltransferase
MFGEYLPFGETWPELYKLLPEGSRFQPGTRTTPMVFDKARIGMLICYEDLLPRHVIRVAAHDPNVFVNLTNDAWFGKSAEPYHHLQLAQLRTIEYRRWLVRATNTGVSVFIDANGRRVQETELHGAETMVRAVPLMEGRTLYAMTGDWPPIALLVILLLTWARALRGGSGRGKPGPSKRANKKKPATKKKRAAPKGEVLEPAKLG